MRHYRKPHEEPRAPVGVILGFLVSIAASVGAFAALHQAHVDPNETFALHLDSGQSAPVAPTLAGAPDEITTGSVEPFGSDSVR